MEIIFLAVVFFVIILLLALKRPLWQAVLGGLAATVILYRIPVLSAVQRTSNVFVNWSSLQVLVSLYLITYLQRMLEARNQIGLAAEDLNGLFYNRRITAMGSALFIGLLPSAAAMLLCAGIIEKATEGYLNKEQQAFVTTWIRHIPESSLPTYSSIILLCALSGVPIGKFLIAMAIPFAVLLLIPYFVYIRKIPKAPDALPSASRAKDAINLFRHLWSLLAILALILVGKLGVVPAVAIVIVRCIFVYRFSLADVKRMIFTAFEKKLILNTFLVLVLKEFIACTGVLEKLPRAMSGLPIPTWRAFALMAFVACVISGASGAVALTIPLAVAAMPAGGVPLAVLMAGMIHAGSQVSPTHVCLVVCSEYYKVPLGKLIKRTIPISIVFAAFMIIYYNLLVII